ANDASDAAEANADVSTTPDAGGGGDANADVSIQPDAGDAGSDVRTASDASDGAASDATREASIDSSLGGDGGLNCVGGTTACGGRCVDIQSDSKNCG